MPTHYRVVRPTNKGKCVLLAGGNERPFHHATVSSLYALRDAISDFLDEHEQRINGQ